jgi:hypothetical protein
MREPTLVCQTLQSVDDGSIGVDVAVAHDVLRLQAYVTGLKSRT